MSSSRCASGVAAAPRAAAPLAPPPRAASVPGARVRRASVARRAAVSRSAAAPDAGGEGAPLASSSSSPSPSSCTPAMVRVLRGERLSVPPVWAMRQAGRYMSSYRELSRRYPRFRDRSEIPELAAEISLQPWEAFRPDGVILFADILTLLTGLGVDWDVEKGVGPVVKTPVRTRADLNAILDNNPDVLGPETLETRLGFLRPALREIRERVMEGGGGAPPGAAGGGVHWTGGGGAPLGVAGGGANGTGGGAPPATGAARPAILGFAGAPFTLATYLIAGGKGAMRSPAFGRLLFGGPEERALFRDVLALLERATVRYALHQAACGADAIQLFDTWAGALGPADFAAWARPSLERVLAGIRAARPDLPVILFVAAPGGVLRDLATLPCDCISVSHTVTLTDAWTCIQNAKRKGKKHDDDDGGADRDARAWSAAASGAATAPARSPSPSGAATAPARSPSPSGAAIAPARSPSASGALLFPRSLQGNVDPFALMGSREGVRERVRAARREIAALGAPAVLNLGHGIMQGTPEDNVRAFFEAAREA